MSHLFEKTKKKQTKNRKDDEMAMCLYVWHDIADDEDGEKVHPKTNK